MIIEKKNLRRERERDMGKGNPFGRGHVGNCLRFVGGREESGFPINPHDYQVPKVTL